MSRLAAVQHLAAISAGIVYAIWKGDWIFVEIQLLAQGAVLFFCYIWPEIIGRPSPREQDAERVRLEENQIALRRIEGGRR